ncbi:MAG: hypothetical protein ABIR94_07550, partial [Rubrivivax sp.]
QQREPRSRVPGRIWASASWDASEHCPNRAGQIKIIAAILEAVVLERILTHLGLQARGRRGRRRAQIFSKPPEDGPAHRAAETACAWRS